MPRLKKTPVEQEVVNEVEQEVAPKELNEAQIAYLKVIEQYKANNPSKFAVKEKELYLKLAKLGK